MQPPLPPQVYVTTQYPQAPNSPTSEETAQSQDDGYSANSFEPRRETTNNHTKPLKKNQYGSRPVGINTEQGLINNVLHRKAKIDACISHNKNMGNGFQDLLSKLTCLEEMIAAIEYLEDNAYEIRTVVGGNPDAVEALNYIPYKSSFKAEMQSIENTLNNRR